ncbi:MAG: hypothetical protein M3Y30_08330 [Gemmatimonadota bacterium]|nr:hypothetical protein [Gemmatimonadota bacterium]
MPRVADDSLVGIVSVTGTSYEQRIVLRVGESARALTLGRDDSMALAQLGGTEVIARGVANLDVFDVHSFTVRAVDGAPVIDGVLERANGKLSLLTESGPVLLGNPPTALDSLVHARIWIGGSPATGPNVYGVIRRAVASAK